MTCAADRDAHLARTARLVSDELVRAPADLVVLPELSSIDHGRSAFCRPWMDETRPMERFEPCWEELRRCEVSNEEIRAARESYDRLPDYNALPCD